MTVKYAAYVARSAYGGVFTFSAPEDTDPDTLIGMAIKAQRAVYYSTPPNELSRITRITHMMTGEVVWESEY